MRTHIPTLILLAGLALPARGLRAAAETEKVPPEKAPAAVEERIAALEKRIQALEQAMVEKDARIADLQRRLNEAPQGPGPGIPGLRFQLNPQDLQRFQEQIQKYMQDGLDGFPGLGEDNLIPAPGAPEERPRWLRPRDLLPAQKPRLGVSLQDANAELMERYKNKVERGAFVTQVLPDTPAEKAGVLTGDCVVSFDHKPIEGAQDLMDTIKAAPEGKHQLVIKRRGEDLGLNVTLGPLIEMPQRVENGWIRGRRDRAANAPREVVEVRVAALELTPQLADALKLDEKQRAKMEAVLAAHAKKLSAEYTEKIGAGGAGRFTLSDKALQPLVDKHAAEAETELRDTLTEAQLKTWRDYRARHRGVSISRNLQIEPEEQKATPEGLNF